MTTDEDFWEIVGGHRAFDLDEYIRQTQDIIRQLTMTQIAMQHQALETMAERMLVDPAGRGIMVVLDSEAGTRTYRLDPGVPFGHIFEFPSQDAVERWRDLGCPR
jgi:hypothetical protein